MLRKCFFLLIHILILCLTTKAAVFVVTSNADSGTGTFRQALLDAAANGSLDKDFIHFNLPDLSGVGRTIIITTLLPDVSTNLVIDGSTQPGSIFGISGSKVCINFKVPGLPSLNSTAALRVSEVDKVEIYGLYLKNDLHNMHGIGLSNNNDIQIGAAGKGNVLLGFALPIRLGSFSNQTAFCKNLTLKGNFFDIDADGQAITNLVTGGASFFGLEGDVEIGGTPAEGNVFATGIIIYQINLASINFKNNKIGINYTATNSFPVCTGVRLWAVPGGFNTSFNIEDNTITAGENYNALSINSIAGPVKIVRNYIGTDKTLQYSLPTATLAINVMYCPQIFIGSSNVADANYITGCKPLHIGQSSVAAIHKNSFFCTLDMYPAIEPGSSFPVTQIAITSIGANKVSGTATPNSSIELFYSDNCGTACAPKTFFATAIANANGTWEYNGALLAPIIASATFNNSTSEFTGPRINRDNLVVTTTCDGRGSIRGAHVFAGAKIEWVDEQGIIAGTSINLDNVAAGKYKLRVNNGFCGDETGFYTIKDESLKINVAQMQLTNASCNQANGKITGISYSPGYVATTTWKNSTGLTVGADLNLSDVPSGQYFLTVTTADNLCAKTYGPITVNEDAPMLVPSVSSVQTCGPGRVVLAVDNPLTGSSYRLYESETSISPLDEQTTGAFAIDVKRDARYFVSQVKGGCESARTEVSVTVGISKLDIANTFTPNADGINDYWKITGIENSPNAIVQVFNRAGQMVFNSKGYVTPFNGTANGRNLPMGNYYYIINMGSVCGVLAGAITIIR